MHFATAGTRKYGDIVEDADRAQQRYVVGEVRLDGKGNYFVPVEDRLYRITNNVEIGIGCFEGDRFLTLALEAVNKYENSQSARGRQSRESSQVFSRLWNNDMLLRVGGTAAITGVICGGIASTTLGGFLGYNNVSRTLTRDEFQQIADSTKTFIDDNKKGTNKIVELNQRKGEIESGLSFLEDGILTEKEFFGCTPDYESGWGTNGWFNSFITYFSKVRTLQIADKEVVGKLEEVIHNQVYTIRAEFFDRANESTALADAKKGLDDIAANQHAPDILKQKAQELTQIISEIPNYDSTQRPIITGSAVEQLKQNLQSYEDYITELKSRRDIMLPLINQQVENEIFNNVGGYTLLGAIGGFFGFYIPVAGVGVLVAFRLEEKMAKESKKRKAEIEAEYERELASLRKSSLAGVEYLAAHERLIRQRKEKIEKLA